jgi:hypothetical protein
MGGGRVRIGNTTSSRTRGPREAEREATAQREVRPCNSNVRQRSRQMGDSSMRRGDITISRTRGVKGRGAKRGEGASRWEAVE